MKLAVSNIGWDPERRSEVLERLPEHGVEGVVIAPTMIFPGAGPYASAHEVSEFRKEVEEGGLAIVGLQSLTFGLNEASLFGEDYERRVLTEHLKRQAELGGALGAASLIFGSPGYRQNNFDLAGKDLRTRAQNVFREVADTAVDNNIKLCIKPLSGYGVSYVTTATWGKNLVNYLDHPGFGLHLDAAALEGQRDSAPAFVGNFVRQEIQDAHMAVGISSFDASAPELMPLTDDETVNHRETARALRAAHYSGFVSLEMRQPAGNGSDPIEIFFQQVDYMREAYTV
jgi:D-psicose/D-tagatose/L-ribulose 3-epimerase